MYLSASRVSSKRSTPEPLNKDDLTEGIEKTRRQTSDRSFGFIFRDHWRSRYSRELTHDIERRDIGEEAAEFFTESESRPRSSRSASARRRSPASGRARTEPRPLGAERHRETVRKHSVGLRCSRIGLPFSDSVAFCRARPRLGERGSISTASGWRERKGIPSSTTELVGRQIDRRRARAEVEPFPQHLRLWGVVCRLEGGE